MFYVKKFTVPSNAHPRRVTGMEEAALLCFETLTIPVALWAGFVKMTLAPKNLINLRRSTENASDMTQTNGYPFTAHTIAKPIPVLPDDASTTV